MRSVKMFAAAFLFLGGAAFWWSPDTPGCMSASAQSSSRLQDMLSDNSSSGSGIPAYARPTVKPAAAPSSSQPPSSTLPVQTAQSVAAAPGDINAQMSTADLSDKERRFFEIYLKRIKYMVTFKKGSALDDFQCRTVAAKSNEYLLKQGFDVVHYDQLQKNMEDQKTVYEAEVGQTMSLIQYLAQKFGADVFVELDLVPRSWSEGSMRYGEANFTANLYDPSTAELIASTTLKSDRTYSTSSEQDAVLNALVSGTAQFMPSVVRDATALLRNRYSNGIRYQLIIQKTADSRAVSFFRRNLRSRVREIQMGPSAADQTIMDVYLFGTLGDLEDACYAAFEKTPGMENAYWIYTRGKTMTFNTGN